MSHKSFQVLLRSTLALLVVWSANVCRGQQDTSTVGFDSLKPSNSLSYLTNIYGNSRDRLGEYIRSSNQGLMLVGHPNHGRGTAWVVSKAHRLLVTNAHVADIGHASGGTMFALLNGQPYLYTVSRVWYHPGVRRVVSGGPATLRTDDPAVGPVMTNSPDVALLQLSSDGPDLPVELTMAEPEDLQKMFAQSACVLGYPGHDTTKWPTPGESVEATFEEGAIGRVTDFQLGVSGPPAQRQFVQYSMSTWGGFSGSPVMLSTGKVVAVHNSGRAVKEGDYAKNINRGIRIDCVWEMLAHHGLADKVRIPVEPSSLNLSRWAHDEPHDIALRKAIELTNEADRLIFIEQDFAAGSAKCGEAIELAPKYTLPYRYRSTSSGNYLFNHGEKVSREVIDSQLRIAMSDAEKVVELNKGDPANLLQLAFVRLMHGQWLKNDNYYRGALKIVAEVLEDRSISDSIRASAYSKRGVALSNLGNDEQAELDHNEAVRLAPTEPAWLETRAVYWEALGRRDLAERDWAAGRTVREMNRKKPAAANRKDLRKGPMIEGPIQKPVQAPTPYVTKEEPIENEYGRFPLPLE